MYEKLPLLVSLCAPPLHLTPPSCQSPMAGPFTSPPPFNLPAISHNFKTLVIYPTPTPPPPAIRSSRVWVEFSSIEPGVILGPVPTIFAHLHKPTNGPCSLYVPVRSSFEAACIHNLGDLKGDCMYPSTVLGPNRPRFARAISGPKTVSGYMQSPFKSPALWKQAASKLLRTGTYKLQGPLIANTPL